MRLAILATLLFTASLRAEPEVAVVGHASLRFADVWDSPLFKESRATIEKAERLRATLLKETGLSLGQIERITVVQFKVASGDNEQTPALAVVLIPRAPLDFAATVKVFQKPVTTERGKLADHPAFAILDGGSSDRIALSEKAIVLLPWQEKSDSRAEMESVMIAKALSRDTERAALMAREKLLGCLALDVSETIRILSGHMFDDGTTAEVPDTLRPLFKARVATLNATFSTSLSFKGEISFGTPADATLAKPAVELMLKQIARQIEDLEHDDASSSKTMAELQKFAASLLASAKVTAKDRTLHLAAQQTLEPAIAGHLASGVAILEAAYAKSQSQSNLRTIASAGMGCQVDCDVIPLNYICDEKGKPLLSWRVRLLPHLGQQELYDQFKLDEPWDSEHNKKLIAKMPKVFAVPTAKESKPGHTFYRAFAGKKGVAARPFLQDGDEKGITFNGISDGLSNTIMVVEAAESVEWTRPLDLPFDADAKVPALGGHFEGGFNVVMGDGTSRFFKSTLDEKVLKALITANGGEEVMLDE